MRVVPAGWERLISDLSPVHMPPHTEVTAQGRNCDAVVLVLSGLVRLIRESANGRRVLVGWRTPGTVIGGASAIANRPYATSASVLAAAELVYVSAKAFRDAVKEDRDLAWNVHVTHAIELHDQVAHAADLACLSGRERLTKFLSRLMVGQAGQHCNEPCRLSLPADLTDIAAAIAVDPQTLSRLLTSLTREHLIQRLGHRTLIVLKPAHFLRQFHGTS